MRDPDADVRVEPAVQPDGKTVAKDRLDEPVPEVVFRESISVMDMDPFPLNRHIERLPVQGRTDFCFEEITHPAVVVPHQIVDALPGVGKFLECRECPVEPARDHRAVIEPEIEEIPHDEQDLGVGQRAVQELQEAVFLGPLLFPRSQAEMNVGNKICFHAIQCEAEEPGGTTLPYGPTPMPSNVRTVP